MTLAGQIACKNGIIYCAETGDVNA